MTASEEVCELCGVEIPEARRAAVAAARTCISCQRRVERGEFSGRGLSQVETFGQAEQEASQPIQVGEGLVRLGSWSASLMEVVGKTAEVQEHIRQGRKNEARALVQSMSVEAQAALVVMDEDPEQMLSFTGMDSKGRPKYSTAVVSRLPSETIASLLSVNPREKEWNQALMRAMTPATLRRAVEETLDPIDDQKTRGKVSWEWLQAVAAVDDSNKAAELLSGCTPDLLEDALVSKMKPRGMNRVAAGVHAFRFFSEEGARATRPGQFLGGEVGRVVDALYDASPDLIAEVVRRAWERTIDGEEDETDADEEREKPRERPRRPTQEDAIREAAAEALAAAGEKAEQDEDADEDDGQFSLWRRAE